MTFPLDMINLKNIRTLHDFFKIIGAVKVGLVNRWNLQGAELPQGGSVTNGATLSY